MSRPQLTVLEIQAERTDTHLVVRAASAEERYFPPLLAAQLLLDVGGLVGQSCYSRTGTTKVSRRWAFAQEIYANKGRGTEAGHFLEHLLLEMLAQAYGSTRRLSAETAWDFTQEPDVYRLHFRRIPPSAVERALAQGAQILAKRDYHIGMSHVGCTEPQFRRTSIIC